MDAGRNDHEEHPFCLSLYTHGLTPPGKLGGFMHFAVAFYEVLTPSTIPLDTIEKCVISTLSRSKHEA